MGSKKSKPGVPHEVRQVKIRYQLLTLYEYGHYLLFDDMVSPSLK
jgi:hypothetical protein